MILSNFAYRVMDLVRQNRAGLIKILLIIIVALILGRMLYYGIEQWNRAQFEKRVEALEREYQKRDAEARAAEARERALKEQIGAKEAERQFLEARAATAEANLLNARRAVKPLKEAYEQIRYIPLPSAPVSCTDACTQLAAVGYPCK